MFLGQVLLGRRVKGAEEGGGWTFVPWGKEDTARSTALWEHSGQDSTWLCQGALQKSKGKVPISQLRETDK